MNINLEKHYGVILDSGPPDSYDSHSATFCSAFSDPEEPGKIYLYYSGSKKLDFSSSSICLAISNDGMNFRKTNQESIIENQSQSFASRTALTPAVIKVGADYYMVFAGSSYKNPFRKLIIAYSKDPKGPFHIIDEIIKPSLIHPWEGHDIDCGPSIVRNNDRFLVYYSNVSSQRLLSLDNLRNRIAGRSYLIRRLGIVELKITNKNNIQISRYRNNPLRHLNGSLGAWNESLFCPGYLNLDETHLLFTSASTYSFHMSPKQYIGVIECNSPYFHKNKSTIRLLINGPKEKSSIIPSIKDEIALDTPSPIYKTDEGRLYLYYSIMDRADKKWKIALSTFQIEK